jgi:hypothetical protein
LLRALAVVALLLALVAAVVARGRDRFEGRVEEGGKTTHLAYPGERLDLVFADREHAGTRYEVAYRQRGLVRQFAGRTDGKGRPSRITLPDRGQSGVATVTWRVGGRTVARWSLTVKRPGERRPD